MSCLNLLINTVKNLILKIIYLDKFKSYFIQNIDFRNSIRIKSGGKITLGKMVTAERYCSLDAIENGHLIIGSHTYFNKFCMISCKSKIIIGSNCLFGPGVRIFDNNHKFDKNNGVSIYESSYKEIEIGDNCWIASNCIILAGSKIGRGSVIGAGSVITGEIPPYSVVTLNREVSIRPMQ